MAVGAIDFINATSVGLLCIQSQFIIGLQFGIFSATGEQHRKSCHYDDGRYSPQVTIMSGAQLFENPGSNPGERNFLMPVAIKRAYEKPSLSDGQRVLVDRLWPRGVKKERARINHWLRDLAPSDTLREWFHRNGHWAGFKKRYFKELSTPEASAELEKLYRMINEHAQVTLIYASRDAQHNNAVALKELLDGMKKPPSSSGPAKAAAASGRVAKRRPS